MRVYYNDNDKDCVAWLKELIAQGHLPKGDIDERSIRSIQPRDLDGYDQCHFFAGIGGWPFALQLAGWDRPVWTGSCPCQPFSAAGKQQGTADERHLWPDWFRLIAECRPPAVFGEQVASKLGREWLAGVFADLESVGYAAAGADLCAAGVGAPHIRQRLYWMADAQHAERRAEHEIDAQSYRRDGLGRGGDAGGVADADGGREGDGELQRSGQHRQQPQDGRVDGMADAVRSGRPERRPIAGNGSSAWGRFDILQCTDGKARRIEPGTFPLAHGIPARVGRLRGYGNAIVPQQAVPIIQAMMEWRK